MKWATNVSGAHTSMRPVKSTFLGFQKPLFIALCTVSATGRKCQSKSTHCTKLGRSSEEVSRYYL